MNDTSVLTQIKRLGRRPKVKRKVNSNVRTTTNTTMRYELFSIRMKLILHKPQLK